MDFFDNNNFSSTVKTKRADFGGIPGNLLLMILLPATTFILWASIQLNDSSLYLWKLSMQEWGEALPLIVPTWLDASVVFAWLIFQAALQIFLPGKMVEGRPLADGSRLKYRMNGLLAFIITIGLFAALAIQGLIQPAWLVERFMAMAVLLTAVSYPAALWLYIYGKKTDPAPHLIGIPLCDYFLGAGHNPRVPHKTGFDFKLFFESRPGLIGWVILNLSFVWTQFQQTGKVSVAIILVTAFQFWYILDYFLHEEAILSTMDIVHEGFGWMLLFGDSVWVPFTYCLQAFYLLYNPVPIGPWLVLTAILLNFTGYYIFRSVNLQKHRFRENPEKPIWGRHPKKIETSSGKPLLASGYWGLSRHFNYVGDLTMAFSWSLPCLFASAVPWFYVTHFVILLIHRQRRDDRLCSEKYGDAWRQYCQLVKWRIFPGIY